VVPKLGSAAPQGAVKDFQGPRRPGKKKIFYVNLKHDFQTTFETFYTLTFQIRGLRRFRRVSRHNFKKLSTF
ncbi:hypothetical protein WDU94_006710, partial [Cyamophila willieti]